MSSALFSNISAAKTFTIEDEDRSKSWVISGSASFRTAIARIVTRIALYLASLVNLDVINRIHDLTTLWAPRPPSFFTAKHQYWWVHVSCEKTFFQGYQAALWKVRAVIVSIAVIAHLTVAHRGYTYCYVAHLTPSSLEPFSFKYRWGLSPKAQRLWFLVIETTLIRAGRTNCATILLLELPSLPIPVSVPLSIMFLRDDFTNQNGWIFGKVPNGNWHSPQSFSENHFADFAAKMHDFETKVRMFIMAGLLYIILSYFPWDASSTTVQHGNWLKNIPRKDPFVSFSFWKSPNFAKYKSWEQTSAI